MGLENIAAGTAGRSIQETGPGRLGFRQAAKITILPGMIVLEKRHTRTLLLQAPAAVYAHHLSAIIELHHYVMG
jgi:hypothetical protein